MLDHYSIVKHFTFNIDLFKPVQLVCQLSFNIHKLRDSDFDLRNLFKQEFLKNLEFDFDNLKGENLDERELLESLILEISSYYNKEILSKLDLNNKTKILLLYEPSKSIFVLNKRVRSMQKLTDDEKEKNLVKELLDTTKNSLERVIKDVKFIENFLTPGLVDEEIKDLINSISFGFDNVYSSSVQIKDDVDLPTPYLIFDFLDTNLIELDLIDENDVLLNKEKLEKELKIAIGTDLNLGTIKLRDSGIDIGIKYNDYVFPIKAEIDTVILQSSKADYRWIQLKEVFSKQDNRNFYNSSLIEEFKTNFRKSKFTELLSHLQDNLFLKSDLLKEKPQFNKYFTSALKLSDIKYLKQYNFFVSDADSSTTLGIYSHTRPAEESSSYNLIHWFNNLEGKQSVYRGPNQPKRLNNKEASSVHTLLPELSFYYISKYFEDFLESILIELELQFLSNFHLWQSSKHIGEFDFLVRHGQRFIFIEAKTTLTKHNINDYQNKCQKVLDAFTGLGIDVEFLIIGSASNDTVEDLKIHIAKSNKRNQRYNVKQDDLGSIPYFFKVPINSEKQITCLSEPNFYKIKTVIKKICQI